MSDPRDRFDSIHEKVERALPAAKRSTKLNVADLGCGTGRQCEVWAERGHAVHGLDIDAALVASARQSADTLHHEIDYRVGPACQAPWPTGSMDVCLAIELLEHLRGWEACLDECARLLCAGGVVFISTTNLLCPRQQEFKLPLYSWYPSFLKHRFEHLAVTSRPELVGGTPYPAIHWFTARQLRRELERRGFATMDRFDMIQLDGRGAIARRLVGLIRAARPVRWMAQVATPFSVVLGIKLARE